MREEALEIKDGVGNDSPSAGLPHKEKGMQKGGFIVSRFDGNPREIHFRTRAEIEPTEDQLVLKSEVEKALVVIQVLYEDKTAKSKAEFERAFVALLNLAQCGLVGDTAQPEVARRALLELKNEITSREAGPTKNRYMRQLGASALILGGIPFFLGSIFHFLEVGGYSNLFFLWAGCMAGVWLSFGIRKTTLSFDELIAPENDRLEPAMRLLFAGLMAVIIGLLFIIEAIVLKIGALESNQLGQGAAIAFVIGALLGVSELALPGKITAEAAKFLDGK